MLGMLGMHGSLGESMQKKRRGEYASVFMGIDEGAYVSIDTAPLVSFAREESLEKLDPWFFAREIDRKRLHILRLQDPDLARRIADCSPAEYIYHDCWPADFDVYFQDERVLHAKVISNELKREAGTKIFLHLCAHSPRFKDAKSIFWVDTMVVQELDLCLRLKKTESSDRCRQCRNDLIGLHIFKRAFPLVDVASNTLRKMLVI